MLDEAAAEALAERLLGDRRTKLGGLSIAHARRVAAGIRSAGDAELVAVAYLHDVIEKNCVSSSELLELTGAPEVVRLVEVLTKREGERSKAYLARCAADPRALLVKRVDLRDKLYSDDAEVPLAAREVLRRKAEKRLVMLDAFASLAALEETTR